MPDSDHPGLLSPRDAATRTYLVVAECGPFKLGEKFETWPYGEVFAMISTRGPVCRTSEIAEWVGGGKLRQIGGPPLRDPFKVEP